MRRTPTRLTISYPDGTTVCLTAGRPRSLTSNTLRAAACALVAHGLATVTGPGHLTATASRATVVVALARLPLTTGRTHAA